MISYIPKNYTATLKHLSRDEVTRLMTIAKCRSLEEFVKTSSNIITDSHSNVYQILSYQNDCQDTIKRLGISTIQARIEVLLPEKSNNPYGGKPTKVIDSPTPQSQTKKAHPQ